MDASSSKSSESKKPKSKNKTLIFTCWLCKDTLTCPPNGQMQSCKCESTKVDYTPKYTRFIGLKPLEEMSQAEQEKMEEKLVKNYSPEMQIFYQDCKKQWLEKNNTFSKYRN